VKPPVLPKVLGSKSFLGRPFAPREQAGENLDRKEPRFSAKHNGFDVHCAVRLAAGDDDGRERLIRSFARPPSARPGARALAPTRSRCPISAGSSCAE
jgi:hypothetical protein